MEISHAENKNGHNPGPINACMQDRRWRALKTLGIGIECEIKQMGPYL